MRLYKWHMVVIACIIIYLISYAAIFYSGHDVYSLYLAADMLPTALSVGMLLYSYRYHRGSIRAFWLLIALGSGCYLGAASVLIYYQAAYELMPPVLNAADILWHMQTVLYIAAMVYIMFKEKTVSQGIRFVFDSIIIMLVTGTIFWEFVVEPNLKVMLDHSSWLSVLNGLLYPVTAYSIATCLFLVNFAYKPLFPRKSLLLFISGIVLFIIADTLHFCDASNGTYIIGYWYEPLWSFALLAVGYSGLYSLEPSSRRLPSASSPPGKWRRLRIVLPYLGLLLLFQQMMERIRGIDGVVIGTTLAVILFVIRQISIMMENDVLVSKLKQMLQNSEFLATHDELSKLPNKRLFERKVEEAIEDASSSGGRLAVFFLDLDRFKFINDSLGHAVGDQFIQQVSDRISHAVSQKHMVARMGGDEFTILVRGFDTLQELNNLAQTIIQAVARPFRLNAYEVQTSTSIGIAVYPEDGLDQFELMKHADTAMYIAKELGGNRVQFFTQAIKDEMLTRMAMERDLRQAIERNELLLHYQPQVCSREGLIVGVEALLRWKRRDEGMVPPSVFVPLAEETGLIVAIGEWGLRTACSQAAQWQREGAAPLKMAVNVSPKQLIQADFVDKMAAILSDSGLAPDSLIIEITEGIALMDTEETTNTLLRLKALGLQIAMDDFGTGYSSLGYLRTFQVDSIKIAQSFIGQITENEEHANIVRAIMAMAHSLSLTVVVEGVETKEQFVLLREINVDSIVQGYYFYKPMPSEELVQLLAKQADTGGF